MNLEKLIKENKDSYIIAVRSYKRHNQILSGTLNFIKNNNLLHKTVVLVANEEEYENYSSVFKAHNIDVCTIITSKGANETHNKFFDMLPEKYNVFCIDDDIIEFYEHNDRVNFNKKTELRNLDDYLNYGFKLIEKGDIGAFTFDYTNQFFKQNSPFMKIGCLHLTGGFFGINDLQSAKTHFGHEDDNYRTINILEKYKQVGVFQWCTVKMFPMYKNTGGMQSFGRESIEYMQNICEKIFKDYNGEKYFKGVVNNNGLPSLKFKTQRELEKITGTKVVRIDEFFGEH